MRKLSQILAGIALITAILACNMPSSTPNQQAPGAIMTAAALTVQAQLPPAPAPGTVPTATFTAVPPPPTPLATVALPTMTPSATPTSNCDNAQFVTDVTYPDNTVVTAGQTMAKTWRIKNIGTCSWTPSYAIVFFSGEQMSGPATQAFTGNVNPGQTIDITVNLTAPSSNGVHTGYWKLRNAAGVTFAQVYITIKVASDVFAVTSVNFNITGTCPNFNFSVTVTTNGAGTVNLHRIFSDGGTDTIPKTLVFSGAGSQSIDYGGVYVSGSKWTDIYIDSPNHQQFGRANFSCP
jgi:hypothetical protein